MSKNNRSFTQRLGLTDNKTINLPLAERNTDYIIKDIRINAYDDKGRVLLNGYSEVSILIDQNRILQNDVGSSFTGQIASFDLNQKVLATSDIEINTNQLVELVTPFAYNVIGLFISFIVAEVPRKKKVK